MQTRYRKVIGDLKADYAKNFMLVLSIAIGIFGIGSILGGYSILRREMKDNYLSTLPASATIETEGNIAEALIDSVEQLPGIEAAERHATVTARMQVEGKWYPLLLFIVDDFVEKKTNKPRYVSGERSPSQGAMLAERTAYVVMQAKEGDQLIIKIGNGKQHKIKLSGTVHDPSLAPAWQEQAGYGYIKMSTLHALGELHEFNQLRIRVSENADSRDHIIKKAETVASLLQRSGYKVHEIQVPPPGQHPHQSQMTTIMSIFVMFSFLILILGSILVGTAMATLMIKQVRQIGVMKTVGADSAQIAGLYLVMILLICVVALVFAIPLSRMAAAGFYNQLAVLLNLEISNDSIPGWVPLLQVASGVLIPLIAAAIPVVRASRIPVRNALDNHGVNLNSLRSNSWLVQFSQLPFISEVFRLIIRNVFRQRLRLIMTIALLAAGGAMFMTALNVSRAWDENLNQLYVQRLYDLEVRLTNYMDTDSLMDKIESIPGVAVVEGWSLSTTSVRKEGEFEITRTYPDKGHGSFNILALPVPTKLLNPKVAEGRWLHHPHRSDVVLNQGARNTYHIGDVISLSVEGKPTEWNVIGFTEDVGSPATAYVPQEMLAEITHTSGRVRMVRIAYADRSKENAYTKNREVEALLEKENISVSGMVPVWSLRNVIAAHMKVLVNSLLAMALLMAVVGTLGLMSTMSMNIMERTRETGVMRAIGATPRKINSLLIGEGLFIGLLSMFIAFLLSLLLSAYMGKVIGHMAFRIPLSLTISLAGTGIWLFIIIAGSYLATYFPARRAARMTTREALAYE